MRSDSSATNRRYIRNINRAFRYIDEHLSEDITLEDVATAAFFSSFHFHRIFSTLTGETVHAYVIRKRLEKAAIMLQREQLNPISQIALSVGFNSHSVFSRAFRKYYGMSPADYRKMTVGKYSKICKTNSKNDQAIITVESYLSRMKNLIDWLTDKAEITLINSAGFSAAAITQIGDNGLADTFNRLIKWSFAKSITEDHNFTMGLLHHDSYKVTTPDKVRMHVMLITEKTIPDDNEVHSIVVAGGRHIKATVTLLPAEISDAWTALFIWMNENSLAKADGPPYEIYHNDFNTHPEKKCIMEMYIPIQ
ncbi:MAG: AraC family transcriptional regulator [Cyclobacteriaceae bacterium]